MDRRKFLLLTAAIPAVKLVNFPVEASGTAKERKLLLRTLDASAKERWRHEIRQSELTFPKS